MEEAGRWEDDVTQHLHIVGSKNIKMEEAARWEDDVTQHLHIVGSKILRWRKPPGEKIMSLSTIHTAGSEKV